MTLLPKANSIFRIAFTIAFSSSGSKEALWSGPSIVQSSVKCFSIQEAPKATAAISTSIPKVWSLYPKAISKVFPIVTIAFKFTSSIGVGYSVFACKTVIFSFFVPAFINIFKASSISPIFAIPVESITFLSNLPICLRYGKFVISPLGILNISRPKSFKSSILSWSNGVDKNIIFLLLQ